GEPAETVGAEGNRHPRPAPADGIGGERDGERARRAGGRDGRLWAVDAERLRHDGGRRGERRPEQAREAEAHHVARLSPPVYLLRLEHAPGRRAERERGRATERGVEAGVAARLARGGKR